MNQATFRGIAANDFIAEGLVELHGAAEARKRVAGPMLDAVELEAVERAVKRVNDAETDRQSVARLKEAGIIRGS